LVGNGVAVWGVGMITVNETVFLSVTVTTEFMVKIPVREGSGGFLVGDNGALEESSSFSVSMSSLVSPPQLF